MTDFELEYRKFEWLPQRHQIFTTFHFINEEVFETLETANVGISKAHSVIFPIFDRNFVNTFHLQNGPHQRQRILKNTS